MLSNDSRLNLELMSKDELVNFIEKMVERGVSLSFSGKRNAQFIEKKVMPRQVKIIKKLSYKEDIKKNILIEGENLQAMVTLFKYRGAVDLIVTDPPYNTGNDFRYNDKWDSDPNDPYLGELVKLEDGSRHTKWMKFMLPRLQMMKSMLKPGGVLAICIDDRELFHLGMLLNEVFGEENRIGIINWQKTYSPKNDNKHLSSATEYVLVYTKDKESVNTNLLERTDKMNSIYKNPDNDPEGDWTSDNPCAKRVTEKDRYAIQSPFTGSLHYPGAGSWRFRKLDMKKYLEKWGVDYSEKSIKDGRARALVIKGANIPDIPEGQNLDTQPVVELIMEKNEVLCKVSDIVQKKNETGVLPDIFFLKNGEGRPRYKRHLSQVQQGRVPLTFWADEDYDDLFMLGCQSWSHEESGHSQTGIKELDYLMGRGHGFTTVKPLKLIEKIIQLWSPNDGIIMDPFSGSGTTGHAVMELNHLTDSERRFILIEKGEGNDDYTKTLTRERLKRAITGERIDKDSTLKILEEPFINEGFEYWQLKNKVDAETILKMRREEMIDVIITSHWEDDRRKTISSIIRINNDNYKYLIGRNMQDEGVFIIWDGKDSVGHLDTETYNQILEEVKSENIKHPYHVYARYQIYQSDKVRFYQIPDRILMHLGLNENSDRYHNESS